MTCECALLHNSRRRRPVTVQKRGAAGAARSRSGQDILPVVRDLGVRRSGRLRAGGGIGTVESMGKSSANCWTMRAMSSRVACTRPST